ncbi:MAG: gamma-glutamyltranspeptidase [Bryobacteraceae bacterium]|nr:MAG: gamma-glutamyltranspeptidase [Bryobacteraceae bacterium]
MERVRWIALLMFAASLAPGQDRNQSRSIVYSRHGVVATSHALATQAGVRILEKGGSAVDAAIAANAVLSVVEPMMCGPGGDLFLIHRDGRSGKLEGLNASGWAPRGLSAQWLREQGHQTMPASGIHSVTVPGAVAGWQEAHRRFGRLAWRELFEDAIRLAEDGHPVHEVIASLWDSPRAGESEEAARVFLPPPRAGQVFRNPALARTLRQIAAGGRDAFYRGPVAEAILAASRKYGGRMVAEDLAEYEPEWVQPISTTYRGWRVHELPPNGQGLAVLLMLNIMEQFPAPASGPFSAEALHWKIESMKLAYADLMAYNADPRQARVPLQGLLEKDYAKRRATLIDWKRARCDAQPGRPRASDTTYLAAADDAGNIVSWIQSIRAAWGSGISPEGTGFLLQNRGSDFVLTPGHPNELQPRKRSFHTIIPGFLETDGVAMAFGIMGGANQPLAHAQFVSNLADYGMNPQAALEAPRFTKAGPQGCDVQLEARVPGAAVEMLRAMGHQVEMRLDYSMNMGRGAVAGIDRNSGVKFAAADPRGDGHAAPALR